MYLVRKIVKERNLRKGSKSLNRYIFKSLLIILIVSFVPVRQKNSYAGKPLRTGGLPKFLPMLWVCVNMEMF